MKQKFLLICAMLLVATCFLASCADPVEGALPSLEKAKKVQNGMTYFEAVEILG